MIDQAKEILRSVFGYDEFRPLQVDVIENILKRNDTLVIMPTGGGKSICYQIPALIFEDLTIVVSPLISLMKDQVEQLQQMGVSATLLNSSLTLAQYRCNVQRVEQGEVRLLYMAPETLLKPNIIPMLSSAGVACLAIDEAHCISEWGHDFRPEYRQLIGVRKRFPEAACIALTATATPRVREDIKRTLGFDTSNEFIASFNRENLFIEIVPKYGPLDQTIEFIKKFPDQSGIIYCFSRRQVDELYEALKGRRFSVRPYHAGLSERDRSQNQELFIRDDVQIVVATIAFGMGINKPNVRFVVHYDLPQNIETYYQEIGRAGRDGLRSHCLMLFGYGDIQKIKHFINKKEGQEQRIANIHLNTLIGFLETEECRRGPLLNYFGEAYPLSKCDMCDNCTEDKQDLEDITQPAQKFLSCAKRTGERFGAGHIIDVLRGSEAKKVLNFGHQRLSTYGIGKDYSKKQWFHLSRQFIQKGLMAQDMEFGGLSLTGKAWQVLKGREKVMGRLEEEKIDRAAQREESLPYDHDLFQVLRKERKTLADSASVPPYVIFSDKTLMEMATFFPHTMESLMGIHGVGAVKLKKYGFLFLEVIKAYCFDHQLEERTRQFQKHSGSIISQAPKKKRHVMIGEMYNAGQSVMKIMKDLNIKQETVLTHLLKYQQEGNRLRSEELLTLSTLPPDRKTDVIKMFERLGTDFLRPVFEAFDGEIGYEELKILRLCSKSLHDFNQGTYPNVFPGTPLSKQFVCLANSRKYSGRCVAGKERRGNHFGGWLRPVSVRETGELSLKETSYKDGSIPELLDIISISLVKPIPHSYQTENYLLHERQWIKKGQLTASDLPRLCDPVDSLWINGYHGRNGINDRMPQELVEEKLTSSLIFIRPEKICMTVEKGPDLLKKVRSRFSFAGEEYWMSITDPFIENKYFRQPIGEYPIEGADSYLTLSISEPYNGFCYKLVAGVLNLF